MSLGGPAATWPLVGADPERVSVVDDIGQCWEQLVDIKRSFDLTPAAPAMARRSLDCLAGAIAQDRLDDLRLVVSELVTNCVQHSGLGEGEAVHLKVELAERAIRVEVTDEGQGFAESSTRPPRHGGWGLGIVERLANRWGHEAGARTTVWAELPLV